MQEKRKHLAAWADMSWALIRTQHGFIRKCFEATVLVKQDGSHNLRMERLGRPYKPNFEIFD